MNNANGAVYNDSALRPARQPRQAAPLLSTRRDATTPTRRAHHAVPPCNLLDALPLRSSASSLARAPRATRSDHYRLYLRLADNHPRPQLV